MQRFKFDKKSYESENHVELSTNDDHIIVKWNKLLQKMETEDRQVKDDVIKLAKKIGEYVEETVKCTLYYNLKANFGKMIHSCYYFSLRKLIFYCSMATTIFSTVNFLLVNQLQSYVGFIYLPSVLLKCIHSSGE